MVRLRRVPVLVSTLALVAGCSSADRVGVSGVVRDGRTGSPLVGARVTGADGVATHTDAEGRFTLSVMRGLRTQLRVSAEGHADAVQSFGSDTFEPPLTLAFELEPLQIEGDTLDPHAVVRWSTAEWIAERFSRGHAEAQWESLAALAIDGGTWTESARRPCPLAASRSASDDRNADDTCDDHDEPVAVGGSVAPWLGAGSRCVECHRDGIAGFEANDVVRGAHAGLGDSCLSCHAEDGAFEEGSCARCHGVGSDTNREWHLELETGLAAGASYDTALTRARAAMARRLAREAESPAAWVRAQREAALAHDPRRAAPAD
jgi:hypothetical protein